MKTRLIIFDMDGTILDTLEDLQDSVNYALKEFNFPLRTISEIRDFVGNGIAKLVERAIPDGTSQEMFNLVFLAFKEYYYEHCFDKTKVYDGIIELLKNLKSLEYKIAVVSNKVDEAVQELCQQYFEDLFDIALGEKTGISKKPSPDAVIEVLNRLHISKEEAIYVGDSEVDVATAKNAGVQGIFVEWGFRDKEYLKTLGANKFIKTPNELFDYLK